MKKDASLVFIFKTDFSFDAQKHTKKKRENTSVQELKLSFKWITGAPNCGFDSSAYGTEEDKALHLVLVSVHEATPPTPGALLDCRWALREEPVLLSSHVPSNIKSTHINSWTADSPRNLTVSLGLESKESIAGATIHKQVAWSLLMVQEEGQNTS